VTVAKPFFPDPLIARVATVVIRLSRVALDLTLVRLPADGVSRTRLDDAIEDIDATIRECQLLAVRNLPSGEDGAGRRPGPHRVT
jgi:hypothetical protein